MCVRFKLGTAIVDKSLGSAVAYLTDALVYVS